MRSIFAFVLITVASAIAAVGCKENAKASAACSGASADTATCEKCCHTNGANGYKYVNGACSCLGGK